MNSPQAKLLDTLTDEIIVHLCKDGAQLSSATNTAKVMRIFQDVVVKFGIGVTKQEATTLDFVHQNIDHTFLRVPRVYRFFTHGDFIGIPIGYLVMEHIDGILLDSVATEEQPRFVKRVAQAVKHLSQIPAPPNQGPGPLFGGKCYGYLWTDGGTRESLGTAKDMEDWLNHRLELSSKDVSRFSLASYELKFFHMDVTCRNIIFTKAGEMCFVDWAFAGFFPPYFQRFCIEWCSSDSQRFIQRLIEELSIPENEKEKLSLGELLRVNSRFS